MSRRSYRRSTRHKPRYTRRFGVCCVPCRITRRIVTMTASDRGDAGGCDRGDGGGGFCDN